MDLREGTQVTLGNLRDVIRKNGFLPKNAKVRVTGKVVEAMTGSFF